jgi:hypothetical protein
MSSPLGQLQLRNWSSLYSGSVCKTLSGEVVENFFKGFGGGRHGGIGALCTNDGKVLPRTGVEIISKDLEGSFESV